MPPMCPDVHSPGGWLFHERPHWCEVSEIHSLTVSRVFVNLNSECTGRRQVQRYVDLLNIGSRVSFAAGDSVLI